MRADQQLKMVAALQEFIPFDIWHRQDDGGDHLIDYDMQLISHEEYVASGMPYRIEGVYRSSILRGFFPLEKTTSEKPLGSIQLTFGSAHGAVYGYRFPLRVIPVSVRLVPTKTYDRDLGRFKSTVMYELFVCKTGRIEAVTIGQIDCSDEAIAALKASV